MLVFGRITVDLRFCVSPPEGRCILQKLRGDLVVMDIEVFTLCEKILKLWEEFLAVEEDRLAVHMGYTPEELDSYLDGIIDGVEHIQDNAI